MQHPAIEGRVALVTGASRGIGSAISLALAKAGAHVAVNYRTHEKDALDLVAQIKGMGRKAVALRADVSLSSEVAAMHLEVKQALGPVDILINNAGIANVRSIKDIDEKEFDKTLAVNLKSAFLCTQAVLPDMRERRFGRIVNISSVAARAAGAVGVHYNASKAGLEGLTRSYAVPLAREGITVNAVAPGLTETEMAQPIREQALPRIPAGRLGTPEEMADAVVFVVTSAFLTGQCLHINGGTFLV